MKHKIKLLENYEICYARKQYRNFINPFIVTTDASGYAIGGILNQTIGKDLPITYTSRLLNKAEQNYFIIEKELFAIVYSVQFFQSYIYDKEIHISYGLSTSEMVAFSKRPDISSDNDLN